MSTKADWHYCGEPTIMDDDGTALFNLPFDSGEYLVTLSSGVVCMNEYDADICEWDSYSNGEVIAWAEKPEPYKPPKQIDNHPNANSGS